MLAKRDFLKSIEETSLGENFTTAWCEQFAFDCSPCVGQSLTSRRETHEKATPRTSCRTQPQWSLSLNTSQTEPAASETASSSSCETRTRQEQHRAVTAGALTETGQSAGRHRHSQPADTETVSRQTQRHSQPADTDTVR